MIQPHFFRMRMARLVLSASICVVAQETWAQNRVESHLQHLFETAEAHNASLQSLEAASREAQAAVETAKAERLPDVSAQASYCYYGNARLWNRHFGESTSAPMPHWGNNYALKASQVVYSGGAVTASIELSKQGAQMARLAKREVQQNVRFALVGLYLQLHHLQNRERVYQANAELTSQLIDQTRQRRKEGTVLANDITRYELQQEQMRLGLVQTSDARDIARHQLVTALGVDALPDVLDGSAFKERPTASLPAWDAWQRVADGGHATLEKERLNVSMSQTKLKLERAAQLPKLALVAEDYLDGPVTIEVPPLNKNLNYWFVGVGGELQYLVAVQEQPAHPSGEVGHRHLAGAIGGCKMPHQRRGAAGVRELSDGREQSANATEKRGTGAAELSGGKPSLCQWFGARDRHDGCRFRETQCRIGAG